jgi:hypothetical protein
MTQVFLTTQICPLTTHVFNSTQHRCKFYSYKSDHFPCTFWVCRTHWLRLPSCRLECPRRIGTTLMPYGVSQMRWITFTLPGVSQTRLSRPHAIWDAWNGLHAIWSIPDTLESPSCHLERPRCNGSLSRRLERLRRVEAASRRLKPPKRA